MIKNLISDELIVAKAAVLANKFGADNLTLKMLASELNIKSPSLYNHVSGLDEIKQRLMIYGWRKVKTMMAEASLGTSGYDALRTMCFTFFEYGVNNKGVFSAMFWYDQYECEEVKSAIKGTYNLLFATMKSSLNMSENDINNAIMTIRSFLEGFVFLNNNGIFDATETLKESFEMSLETIIKGIKTLEREK